MNQSIKNQSIKSKPFKALRLLLLCSIGFVLGSDIALAQVAKIDALYKTIKANDSILFKIGFDQCKIDQSAALMSDDLEFYHDKSGITNSKSEFVSQMKNGLCKRNNPEKIYRFLVEESMQVYPMYNNGKLYGALQNGKHFFSPSKTTSYTESDNYALFSHLWVIENEKWKLKRVISYNHVAKKTDQ